MKNYNKKNLAFFIHTLGRGGAEQVLVDLINGLDKTKFDVTLYPILNTGELFDKLDKSIRIVPIVRLPKLILKKNTNQTGTLVKGQGSSLSVAAKLYAYFWREFPNLFKYLAKQKVGEHDLFISYLEGPTNKLVSLLDKNEPKIAWIHVDLSIERKSEIFFKSKEDNISHLRRFDEIIAVSEDVGKSVKQHLDPSLNVRVINNIYNNKIIVQRSKETLSNEDTKYFSKDKINVVSVGRLSKQKGYDRLLKALLKIKEINEKNFDNLNILIIGDGEEKNNLESLSKDYGLQESVSFLGFKSNPHQFIKNADCFISSSRTEGFSTVVVESLIIGTPVFATDCSGMSEILDDGKIGFIEENSTEGIEKLLYKIQYNKQNIQNLENMILKGKNKFDMNKQLLKHQDYFISKIKEN